MFNKKILMAVAVVSGLLLATFSACTKKESNIIKIGAILPLTGPVSNLGQWVKNGMDIAVSEVNASGGLNGKNIQVVYADSKADPKEGLSAFTQMLNTDNPPVYLSAMTGVTNALIPVADKNKRVLFATTVSASGVTEKSSWVRRLFITADIDAKTMAQYAAEKLGLKKVAIILVNDDMGLSFAGVFKTVFEAAGGKVVAEEAFEKGNTDFRSVLAKLKKMAPDGLYIVGYDNNLGVLPQQIREAKIKSTILSIGTLGQPNVLVQAGASLEGAYFTTTEFSAETPRTEQAKHFAESYSAAYKSPANYFSTFAYDSVKIIAETIKTDGSDPEAIRSGLLKVNSYGGVTGNITVKPNGDADFPMVVKKIINGKIEDVH